MADIKPTLDSIDDAIEGYVTWSGYSPDAAAWSATESKDDLAGTVAVWVEEHLDVSLSPWQEDLLRRIYGPRTRDSRIWEFSTALDPLDSRLYQLARAAADAPMPRLYHHEWVVWPQEHP